MIDHDFTVYIFILVAFVCCLYLLEVVRLGGF